MALVSYALAKAHLRLTDDESKAAVNLMAEQASAMVLKYIGREAADSPAWDDSIDPADDSDFAIVQANVLKVLTHLWRYRGDDAQLAGGALGGPLTEEIRNCLLLVKDHTLA